MNDTQAARELVAVVREITGKGEVPEAFKKQWKNKDKDGDGKENEPKPDFLKKKDKKAAQELVAAAREMTADSRLAPDGRKLYYTMMNVGRAKYVVNFHDGVKTHGDGSPFYDIALFSNKKVFKDFVRGLERSGFDERD